MKVIDILRVKGGTLFTVSPDEHLSVGVTTMADQDSGSLVVMAHGELVGMLTFREVIEALVRNGGSIGSLLVRGVMDDHPLTCTPETEMDEVRFYDVAKAVVDGQDVENRMLKAYIRDWPVEEQPANSETPKP